MQGSLVTVSLWYMVHVGAPFVEFAFGKPKRGVAEVYYPYLALI